MEAGPYVVPANDSLDVDYKCDLASGASGTNTATATWDAALYNTLADTASGSVDYAFTTPDTIIDESITVEDTAGGSLGTASVGEDMPKVFSYNYSWLAVGGICKDYGNKASFVTIDIGASGSAEANVTVCSGLDLTVTKTAAPHFTRTYQWTIDKSVVGDSTKYGLPGALVEFGYDVTVNHNSGTDSGWYIEGVITVSNPNLWQAVTLTSLSDSLGAACTMEAGPYVVPANDSLDVDYKCDLASGASGTNTATATWDAALYNTLADTASGSVDYAFTTPDTIIDESITVEDTAGGSLGTASVGEDMPKVFSYNYSWLAVGGICKDYGNKASFVTIDIGASGSAEANVTVCSGLDLTVTKTAAPHFTRTYQWTIDKSVVGNTTKYGLPGALVEFGYDVTVNHNSGTDSGWYIEGVITVSNPNLWQAVTLTSLSDSLGAACTMEAGPYVVPANDSLDVDYKCDLASGASGTNTATATWDAALYNTLADTASGSVDYAFTTPDTIIDESITVEDTAGGSLGTASVGEDMPKGISDNYSWLAVGGICKDYGNKASFVTIDIGASGSAEANVTVCSGLDLTVTKTAEASYTKTWTWDIVKEFNTTLQHVCRG